MDNSMTTWIIVALLVLLIGAAIFMLLRRPGGDDSLDGRDAPAMDRDTDHRGDLDGRTAPEETQAVAADGGPAREETPFDQTSYDTPAASAGVTGGATPVDRADVEDRFVVDDRAGVDEGYDASPAPHVADDTTETSRSADDFFGVDREPREKVEPDPAFQDPRTDGHLLAQDEARHDEARHDEARHDETRHDGTTAGGVGGHRPGDEGYLGAPASEGYHAEPASEGYHADPADEGYRAPRADEQADQAPPAASEPPQQHQRESTHHVQQDEHPAGGAQDEPLTADEVLASRDVADRDHGDGYAEPPVTTGVVADEPTDEPAADEQRSAPVGGHVFAESVYGVGSVEPAEDGSGPEGWEVKGNTGSMLFHTADSPSYDAVRAEVWFDSEESARHAGFAHWDRRRR